MKYNPYLDNIYTSLGEYLEDKVLSVSFRDPSLWTRPHKRHYTLGRTAIALGLATILTVAGTTFNYLKKETKEIHSKSKIEEIVNKHN